MPKNNKGGARRRNTAAGDLAVQALAFLADDPTRIARFLATSGIELETLRHAAAQPDFLAGVLNFIAEDEALLVSFAEHVGVGPAEVDRARQALAGTDWERDVP
jgi:hypothetical protein